MATASPPRPDLEAARRRLLPVEDGPEVLDAGAQALPLGGGEGNAASGGGLARPAVGARGVVDGDPPGLAVRRRKDELRRGGLQSTHGIPEAGHLAAAAGDSKVRRRSGGAGRRQEREADGAGGERRGERECWNSTARGGPA